MGWLGGRWWWMRCGGWRSGGSSAVVCGNRRHAAAGTRPLRAGAVAECAVGDETPPPCIRSGRRCASPCRSRRWGLRRVRSGWLLRVLVRRAGSHIRCRMRAVAESSSMGAKSHIQGLQVRPCLVTRGSGTGQPGSKMRLRLPLRLGMAMRWLSTRIVTVSSYSGEATSMVKHLATLGSGALLDGSNARQSVLSRGTIMLWHLTRRVEGP